MSFSTFLPTLLVTLREGFEAALVVGIVLACLNKAGQSQLNSWVYKGIGGGIVASVMVGLLLGGILQQLATNPTTYTPLIKEGIFGLTAVVMLTWMLLWMTQQASSMRAEVEGAIKNVLAKEQDAGKGIFLLIFIAVLREGFETVLFILAQFEQDWLMPSLGAITGLLLAAGLGVLLFKWGVKINIRRFFQVMGVLLVLIVGGLLIGVLKHLDGTVSFLVQSQAIPAYWCFSAPFSCLLGSQAWNLTTVLPDNQFPGIILKSLLGYRQTLYIAQAIAYVLFVVLIGGIYWQSLNPKILKPKIST